MDTNIAALQTALQAKVNELTAGSLLIARAQVALDEYIAACERFANINRGAAASYSDVRGTVSKWTPETARAERDRCFDELAAILLLGDVEIQTDASLAYWSLGI